MVDIQIDSSELFKYLEQLEEDMPRIGKKVMQAVNNEVKKRIRQEARARGYSASTQRTYKTLGIVDSGYKKNLKSYANNNFTGKIMFTQNAFYYRFIEYGATVPERTIRVNGRTIKLNGFELPARPIMKPIADSIWNTSTSVEIMNKTLQKELDKRDKK